MRNPKKAAMEMMLQALVEDHVENGGTVSHCAPQVAPRKPNFSFNALNKARSCGAGRGGLNHKVSTLPRVVR